MINSDLKGTIELNCTEQALSEFPNLLFGTQIDTGVSYFDATLYLQKQAPETSIKLFFITYRAQIQALCDAYDIPHENIYRINQNGHYLIDGNFVYLFISFVEPDFLAYMCDRTHELMTTGITISDTYLFQSAKHRLSPEIISMMYEHGKEAKQ